MPDHKQENDDLHLKTNVQEDAIKMATQTAAPMKVKHEAPYRTGMAYPTLEDLPAHVDIGFSAPAAVA